MSDQEVQALIEQARQEERERVAVWLEARLDGLILHSSRRTLGPEMAQRVRDGQHLTSGVVENAMRELGREYLARQDALPPDKPHTWTVPDRFVTPPADARPAEKYEVRPQDRKPNIAWLSDPLDRLVERLERTANALEKATHEVWLPPFIATVREWAAAIRKAQQSRPPHVNEERKAVLDFIRDYSRCIPDDYTQNILASVVQKIEHGWHTVPMKVGQVNVPGA